MFKGRSAVLYMLIDIVYMLFDQSDDLAVTVNYSNCFCDGLIQRVIPQTFLVILA